MWFKNMCNLITWPWPRLLLTLSFTTRLGLCLLFFPLCVALYFLTSPTFHTNALLTIPMGLSSWLFNKRGACTCFFGYALVQATYNSIIFRGAWWPADSSIAFAGILLVLFLEGATLVSLQELLAAEAASRQKAEQGERQITLAYEQQCELNQLKNQFIVNVNHELRTPLTAIYSYLEMLQLILNTQGSLDREAHTPLLNTTLQYCDDLRTIANSVLDTLEIDHQGHQLKIEGFSVAELVESTIMRFDTFRHQAWRIRLDIPPQIEVQANAQCMRQVLHNLLSNAFKYSPDNTPVIIRACYIEDGSQVCISVQDAGPGIPRDEIALLFEQFTRLKRDLASTTRGTGLGLYISKRLVHAMRGQIRVESLGIAGLGSCFYITLPGVCDKTSAMYYHNAVHQRVPGAGSPQPRHQPAL